MKVMGILALDLMALHFNVNIFFNEALKVLRHTFGDTSERISMPDFKKSDADPSRCLRLHQLRGIFHLSMVKRS